MNHDSERRHVLIGTSPENQGIFRELFKRHPLDQWVMKEAESYSQARFVLQHDPCDVLLVNDDLYEREGAQGLAWLAWQREVPIVLLVGQSPETYARAYQLGVSICLPREPIFGHPPMLAAGLDQALNICEMRFGYRRIKEQLAQSRRHTDCLVNLLWRATPHGNESSWLPQRSVLERLCEETARTERHAIPMTMALGEVQQGDDVSDRTLPDWAARLILHGKRRCDVAGQYGTNGFLLLLVHTSKDGGMTCVRRLQKILEQPPQTVQPPHRPQTFFGVVSFSPEKNTPQALLHCVEERLDAARSNIPERIAAD